MKKKPSVKKKSFVFASICLIMMACLLFAPSMVSAYTTASCQFETRNLCYDEDNGTWNTCPFGGWSPTSWSSGAMENRSYVAGPNMTYTVPTVPAGYRIYYTLHSYNYNSWGPEPSYTLKTASANPTSYSYPASCSATYQSEYHRLYVFLDLQNMTLTATSGANGSVSPSGSTTIKYGRSQTYTITPNAGYKVADVLVDGVSVGAVNSYTFENVTANHTISATFENNPPVITNVSCPTSLQMGETGTCTATATGNGTVAFRWTANNASFSSPGSASTDMYFLTGGTKIITVEAYIVENPAAKTTTYASVDVSPINLSLNAECPASASKVTSFNCSATGTTDWGTPAYTWTANNPDVVLNPTNAPNISGVGAHVGERTITAKMYLVERPHLFIEQTMNISIVQPPPVITGINCTESILLGQTATCTVQATVQEGTIGYNWSVPDDDGIVVSGGNSSIATIRFKKAGQMTANVRVYLTDFPSASPALSSANVTVTDNPITATINCPDAAISGEEIACTVDASVAWGTLKYDWKAADNQASSRVDGNTGYLKFFRGGDNTVKLDVSIEEAPFVTTTVTSPIKITSGALFVPVITGPRYAYTNIDTPFSVSAPCLESNICTIKWSVDGTEKTGTSVTLNFQSPTKTVITAETLLTNGAPGKSTTHNVYVSQLPKPMFSIIGPSAMFVGKPATYKVEISQQHKSLPVVGKWLNETESGEEITVVPDATGTFNIDYKAWIDGFKEITAKTITRKINVVNYVFPDPKISVKTTEASAPAMVAFKTVDANKRTPGALYKITYNWDFGDGETLETDRTPVTHVYSKAGTYVARMIATDTDGNTASDQVTMNIGVQPVEVTIKASPSNEAMRAPLTVYARSNIGKKASLDKIDSYAWLVNGVKQEDARAEYMKATFNEPGNYTITFNVTMASTASGTSTIDVQVNPNQTPTCSVSHTDDPTMKYVTFVASCNDADGRISGYKWDLDDGRGYRLGFTRTSMKVTETRTLNIKLQATDDAGGVTEVAYPVTITR